MQKLLLTVFLSIIFLQPLYAQKDPHISFRFANNLYSEARYEEAAKEYESILSDGFEGGSLYYNLGNAYFKAGELGKAILSYKKAQRFIPRDADLNANLNVALSAAGLTPVEAGGIKRVSLLFNDGELAAWLYLSYLALILVLCVRLFVNNSGNLKKAMNYLMGLACLALLSISALFLSNIHNTRVVKKAIVLKAGVECRFAPQENATVFFELGEGEDVIVYGTDGDWTKVERFDGKVGWARSRTLGLI